MRIRKLYTFAPFNQFDYNKAQNSLRILAVLKNEETTKLQSLFKIVRNGVSFMAEGHWAGA